MHIALCDDNVADRKQFERLIKKEADARSQAGAVKATDVLYMDSYGSASSLLRNPMQYDVFYIDVCKSEGVTGVDIARQLLEKGVNAPIVMCCSEIDYRQYAFPDNVIFLNKPIIKKELNENLTKVLAIKDMAVSLIELRAEDQTYYLEEQEILYGIANDRFVDITLRSGQTVRILDTIKNLFAQWEPWPTFFTPTKKAIVNGRYLKQLKFGSIVMCDGTSFHISHELKSFARKMMEDYPN